MELILAVLLGVPVLGYGLWFLAGLLRYVRSGEYETDQRLTEITE